MRGCLSPWSNVRCEAGSMPAIGCLFHSGPAVKSPGISTYVCLYSRMHAVYQVRPCWRLMTTHAGPARSGMLIRVLWKWPRFGDGLIKTSGMAGIRTHQSNNHKFDLTRFRTACSERRWSAVLRNHACMTLKHFLLRIKTAAFII